jgi:hypothetical protein
MRNQRNRLRRGAGRPAKAGWPGSMRMQVLLSSVIAAVAVAGLGVGVGLHAAAASGSSAPAASNLVQLQTVSGSRLAQDGMFLEQPSSTPAGTITSAQAEAAAVAAFPGTSPREAALVQLSDSSMPTVNGSIFWTVSLGGFQAPSGGPPTDSGSRTVSFALAFVSPQSGQVVFVRYGT